MTETPPIFANRYRFEPVGSDWDRGRSGFTYLVYDIQDKRYGVIKRAETISERLIEGLKNEENALRALKGLGVPELYDANQSVYDAKNYNYLVIEYLDEMRVEKSLESLSVQDRAEIITQLFYLLSQSHQKGIVNGDVDLKHLFWRKDKKQLVVIDWGNAKLGVDPKKKSEFAYDLARAAEIIFSLVTQQGSPPATGSIALPDSSKLLAGFESLPEEFQILCKWAPRTPDGSQAPYTAKELFEVSKEWLRAVKSSKPYKPVPPFFRKQGVIFISLLGVIVFASLAIFKFLEPFDNVATSTNTITTTVNILPTSTPTETLISTNTPVPTLLISTETLTPATIPSPLEYSPLVAFEDKTVLPEFRLCWTNSVNPTSELVKPEGFNRKDDNTWWIFNTGDNRTIEESVIADFSTCSNGQPVNAIALNTWVTQVQPESGVIPAGEFGIFLKTTDGFIREYMLWVDQAEKLHLRIRENTQIVYDDEVLVVSKIGHAGRDNKYNEYRIQIFLELDNNGSAIIYLFEADSNSVTAQALDASQMIRIDSAVLPKLENIAEFGLIGRGGSTQVLIWPIILLGK